jgi:hypothetical protein
VIRFRLQSKDGSAALFAIGITDLNLERLRNDRPIRVDLAELGGEGVVVVFHGADADGLRRQLAAIVSPVELARLTPALDQLDATERDIRAKRWRASGAPHDSAGGDEHRAIATGEDLTEAEIDAWCARIDELLAARPVVAAHQRLNADGAFAFSPATCPLCRELADIEIQARAEILAGRNPDDLSPRLLTSKDVPCPTCGAQPGDPCRGSVRAHRGHRRLSSSHRARIEAARERNRTAASGGAESS